MRPFSDWFDVLTRQINILFANKEPWQIATITATSVLTTVWIWEQINQDESKICKIFRPFNSFLIS